MEAAGFIGEGARHMKTMESEYGALLTAGQYWDRKAPGKSLTIKGKAVCKALLLFRL